MSQEALRHCFWQQHTVTALLSKQFWTALDVALAKMAGGSTRVMMLGMQQMKPRETRCYTQYVTSGPLAGCCGIVL